MSRDFNLLSKSDITATEVGKEIKRENLVTWKVAEGKEDVMMFRCYVTTIYFVQRISLLSYKGSFSLNVAVPSAT